MSGYVLFEIEGNKLTIGNSITNHEETKIDEIIDNAFNDDILDWNEMAYNSTLPEILED